MFTCRDGRFLPHGVRGCDVSLNAQQRSLCDSAFRERFLNGNALAGLRGKQQKGHKRLVHPLIWFARRTGRKNQRMKASRAGRSGGSYAHTSK
eukprot:2113398-Rhodomonas_salina.1